MNILSDNFKLTNEEIWYLQTHLTVKEIIKVQNYLTQELKINYKGHINFEKIINKCNLNIPIIPKFETIIDKKIFSFNNIELLLNKKWLHPSLLAFQYCGNIEILKKPKIAIIGSRKPTYYGRKIAFQFAKELAQAGCTIISGGAIGIDTIANGAAFENGLSCAVIGSGLNHLYPASNIELFQTMLNAKNAVIISEFHSFCRPQKWNFPRRNITIAALCDFVLVIEAVKTSGSLITAYAAIDIGNHVGAIPGDISNLNSEGCHELIKNGAYCIQSPKDILEIINFY